MSMVDIVSNLVGEIIEIYDYAESIKARGTVRAIYVANATLVVLLEHNLRFDSIACSSRSLEGGFEIYSLVDNGRVRAVRKCERCYAWDQKANMEIFSAEGCTDVWEHKPNEGCRR